MNDKNTFDKMFDALLDEALTAVESEPNPDLPEEMDVVFSDRHNAAMKKMFDSERRKIRRKQLYRSARHMAAALVVLILVSGVTVMSANALKTRLFNFVFNTSQTNTEITAKEVSESGKYESDVISLGYLPEGYILERQSGSGKGESIILAFRNETSRFTIITHFGEGKISINTENAECEQLNINGKRALYTDNVNENIMTIYYDDVICTIHGNIPKEEIVEIAQNLKIK